MSEKVPSLAVGQKGRNRTSTSSGKKSPREEGKRRGTREEGKKRIKDSTLRLMKSPRRKTKEEKGQGVNRSLSDISVSRRGSAPAPQLEEKKDSAQNSLRRSDGSSGLQSEAMLPADSPVHSYRRILFQLCQLTAGAGIGAMEAAGAALLPPSFAAAAGGRLLLNERELGHVLRLQEEVEKLLQRQRDLRGPMLLQRAVRSFLARRKLERTRAGLHPAALRFHEFIKEELRYLEALDMLVNEFFVPIRSSADAELVARKEDVAAIFSNVDKVEAVALAFVNQLRAFSDKAWPHLRGVGTVFIEMAPELAVYDRYAKNHVYSLDRLKDMQETCASFAAAVKEREERLGVCLNDLLLLPLHHMAEYTEVLRMFHVPGQSNEDTRTVLDASAVMQTRVASAEAALAESNNLYFVSEVQRTLIAAKKPLNKEDPIMQSLDVREDGRVFVSEMKAELKVKKGAIAKKVPVKLLAFNDVCLVVRQREEKNALLDVFRLDVTVVKQQAGGFTVHEVDEDHVGNSEAPMVPGSERRFTCDADVAGPIVSTLQSLGDLCQHRAFGVDLEFLLEREKGVGIPAVLRLCGDYLRKNVQEEGILRVPGSKANEKLLVAALNKSTDVDFLKMGVSVNDVGTVFKHYLRDLPRPLISQEARKMMVSLHQKFEEGRNEDKYIDALRDVLVGTARPAELDALCYVAHLMWDLAHLEKGKDNKMDCVNLATCVGPDIMQPEAENMEQVLLIPVANNSLGFLFENWELIFAE